MRSHLAKLTPRGFVLLTVPSLAIAYSVVMNILPAIVHALIPNVVRAVLQLI
jgi:hypothetical protein